MLLTAYELAKNSRHSSPRPSVKYRFGRLSAGFDLCFFFLRCRFRRLSAGSFGVLSAGFGVLSPGFVEKRGEKT